MSHDGRNDQFRQFADWNTEFRKVYAWRISVEFSGQFPGQLRSGPSGSDKKDQRCTDTEDGTKTRDIESQTAGSAGIGSGLFSAHDVRDGLSGLLAGCGAWRKDRIWTDASQVGMYQFRFGIHPEFRAVSHLFETGVQEHRKIDKTA